MQFKVGDRVVMKRSAKGTYSVTTEGSEGIIQEVYTGGIVRILFDKWGYDSTYSKRKIKEYNVEDRYVSHVFANMDSVLNRKIAELYSRNRHTKKWVGQDGKLLPSTN